MQISMLIRHLDTYFVLQHEVKTQIGVLANYEKDFTSEDVEIINLKHGKDPGNLP